MSSPYPPGRAQLLIASVDFTATRVVEQHDRSSCTSQADPAKGRSWRLTNPLPSGTRSLLLQFEALDGSDGEVTLGTIVTVGAAGEQMMPGRSYADAGLTLWADVARLYATVGSSFQVWYGRVVGHGTVNRDLRL